MLPLPPSRTIGNVGVSTGAGKPSWSKILSQIDAYNGEEKRYMRKFDACVGREARINKLLLKKPPGLMSASGASLDEPLRAIKEKMGRREM